MILFRRDLGIILILIHTNEKSHKLYFNKITLPFEEEKKLSFLLFIFKNYGIPGSDYLDYIALNLRQFY
jgi:hypothetical protein